MGLLTPRPHPGGPAAIYLRTLCFVFHGEDVLLICRVHPPDAGFWNGIGGKIERGEDPLEAAQRELAEEAGLRAALTFRGVATAVVRSTWEHWAIFLFSGDAADRAVTSSSEGALRWCSPDEVSSLAVWPDVPVLLRHLRRPGVMLAKFTYRTPEPDTLEASTLRVTTYGDG